MPQHPNSDFPVGAIKPATLKLKRRGRAERYHAVEAGQGGADERNFGASLRTVLCREFPHGLPLSRGWWMLLALLEWSVCSCVFWFVAIGTWLVVSSVRGHMEYCCGAYAWVAFGVGWLFPLALLLTGWKRSFAAARWLLLGMGGLCVASATVNLVEGGRSAAPIFMPVNIFGGLGGELPLMMAVYPLMMLGAGCLLRACCGRRYGHCFYVAALISSWQRSRRAFAVLAGTLALYAGAYLVESISLW